MKSWRYILPVLKPERAIISNVALWIGLVTYYRNITNIWAFLLAFFSYLLFYGGIYILNDIADLEVDKRDSHNKSRLIVSGKMSPRFALVLAAIILVLTLSLTYIYSPVLFWVMLVILGINVTYSGLFKKVAYFDIIFVSLTQPLKYIVALLLCGILPTPYSLPWLFLVVVYLVSVFLHAEKQYEKMQSGRVRDFIVGAYSLKGLRLLENTAMCITLLLLVAFHTESGLYWSIIIFLGGVILRLRESRILLFWLEKYFQQR